MAKRFKMPAKKKPAKSSTRPSRTRSKQRAGSKGKRPRQPALPGTEQVRNQRLDRLCEDLGECRDQSNRLKSEEKEAIGDALREMQKADITVYKHAGVVMARLPGAEKLTVRLTKDHGDAGAEDLEEKSDEVNNEDGSAERLGDVG